MAEVSSSPSKEDSLLYQIDENREKHILQMDAKALMITLRELEAAITAESDPKVVPAWARSIIPRLEGLESKLTKAMKVAKASSSAASEASADDDHAVEKLVKEFSSKLDITKITFSSQIEALNLEGLTSSSSLTFFSELRKPRLEDFRSLNLKVLPSLFSLREGKFSSVVD